MMLRRPGGERRIAPATPELGPDCGRCHLPGGEPRIIVGVGTQRLHHDCERRLSTMGYEVREDRRHGQ